VRTLPKRAWISDRPNPMKKAAAEIKAAAL